LKALIGKDWPRGNEAMTKQEQDSSDPRRQHGEEAVGPSKNGNSQGDAPPSPAPMLPDGCIPAELRDWLYRQFPENDLLRSLDDLNEQECRQLSEFLNLSELERMVASERAQRQR
jgi:hypothetical protein